MKHRFYGMTFRTRVWMSFTALTVASIVVTGILTYYIAASAMQQNAMDSSAQNIVRTSQVLDERFKKLLSTVTSMMISDAFKDMIKDSAQGHRTNYFRHLNDLQNVFDQFKMYEPMVDSILVTTPIGSFYPTDAHLIPGVDFKKTELYPRLGEKDTLVFVESHRDPFFQRDKDERVLSMVMRGISYLDVAPTEVYVIVNLKEKNFIEFLSTDTGLKGSQLFLINEAGQSILRTDDASVRELGLRFIDDDLLADPSNKFEYDLEDRPYLVAYSKLGFPKDWMIVSLQAKEELLSKITPIRWTVMILTVACSIAAVIVANALMGILMKPLKALQSIMKKVEQNDLTVRYVNVTPYQDEVNLVGHQFNRMLNEVSRLVKEIEEVAVERKKAEIKALQAQVDPHFLYNTLNSMYWKAQIKNYEDVQAMIIDLSQLFQLGLNNGRELTTVERELNHVRHYLDILVKCYEGLFEYEIHVEEPQDQIQPIKIIKLLLQPLVENAVQHGFKRIKGGGSIVISIGLQGEMLELSVTDNGEGMDPEAVFSEIQNPTRALKGFALRNVYNRLMLYYGNRARMSIESVSHVATTVKLVLPIDTE